MKKYIALLSVISITAVAPLTVHADSIDSKINEVDTTINNLKEQKKSAESELAALDSQIATLEAEVEKTLQEKVALEQEVTELLNDIDSLTKAIEMRTEKLSEQARVTQVSQASNSLLQVVLESESISDAVTKSVAYGKIMKANDEIAECQKEDKEELSRKKADVEKKLVLVEEKTESLKVQQDDLNTKRYDQAILKKEVEASLTKETSKKDSLLKEKAEIEERQRKAEEAAKEKARIEAEYAKNLANEQSQLEAQAQGPISNGGSTVINVGNSTPQATSGAFCSPLSSLQVTSPYGYRQDPTGFSGNSHDGIDFAGVTGQSVFASLEGTVVASGFDGSAGNYIIIQHGNGKYTYYLHLSRIGVGTGASVATGQVIGAVGNTGNSTGPHLHFGIATTPNWSGFMNPAPFLGIG